ncbi:MAG: site-specific integrase [Clostridiales Family XIII bacterium]|jgi:integrase|nr:site-specific integrase [Clostridiales Family XIII bacterium]
MARRGENIRKRKDGRWEGRFIKTYDETRRAKYGSVYAKSYKECKKKLINARFELGVSRKCETAREGDVKLDELLREWLASIRPSIRISTHVKYRNAVVNHIIPALGNIKAKEITGKQIEKFLLRKRESGRLDNGGGLSVGTVQTLWIILSAALAYGTDGMFPAHGFKFRQSKPDVREVCTLNEHEQHRLEGFLLQNLDPSKFGVLLCLYTGLRIGEICSLRWEDIDREHNVIRVKSTVQRIQCPDEAEGKRTKLIIGAPKSKTSLREIPISSCVRNIITEQYTDRNNGFVVTGGGSAPLDPRTYQYRFQSYLKHAKVNPRNFHALRHSFATNCIRAGFDPKTLSEILGHASVNITLNRYVHSSKDMKQTQMELLSRNRGHFPGSAQGAERSVGRNIRSISQKGAFCDTCTLV